MTIEELHLLFLKFPNACTDTRKITENCIFFALKGSNFNGNRFAAEALDKGAAYCIIDESEYQTSSKTILVEDVLTTLQQLATYHRMQSRAKVISLTGSNGKTTTKELMYAVLSKKYRTKATVGNLNNHIGVPLTLLTITEDTEIAIVEMGANHKKEIAFLSEIARPNFGYITNFGKAHIEGFGGVEGVIQGKSELYDYIIEQDGYLFFNADDPIQLKKLTAVIKKFGYSQENHHYYKIQFLKADPFVRLAFENIEVTTQLVGKYNFTNCCAAIILGKYFNVPLPSIKEAIENYVPENNRSQILQKKGHTIILDAYNANPTSMQAALENFKNLEGEGKLLFLGDMFELGATAKEEHQNIADMASSMGFSNVFLIGSNFHNTNTKLLTFESFEDLSAHLKKESFPASKILIKGSRGMALERILDIL